jgi:hypothetical protein
MKTPYLIEGKIFSPHLVFIKYGNSFSDEELLSLLGLKSHIPMSNDEDAISSLYLTDSNGWINIIDDWLYSLWYSSEFRTNVELLAKKYEVFWCSIGEADDSYDFSYYKNGLLQRKYVVEDPDYTKGHVTESIGQPLTAEAEALTKKDNLDKVLLIAKSIGINTDYQNLTPRKYGIPKKYGFFKTILNKLS